MIVQQPYAPLPLVAHNRYDVFDLLHGLYHGQWEDWAVLAAIVGCIAFFALYKKLTGRDFVKTKKERRAALRRRKHVLWEYNKEGD